MDLRILEIASHTENNKIIKNFTHKSKNKNPLCGDEMEISLIIENDVIKDLGYQCSSCIYCQASASLLSRKIKNRKLDDLRDFLSHSEKLFDNIKVSINKHWSEFKEILKKENLQRKECLLLPIKTVLKALKN